MDLIAIARWIPTNRVPKGDDGIDRLHYLYTPAILSLFTVLISMQQYVGSPITCLAPDHLTASQKNYATTYCWIKNTYNLPFSEEIPKDHQKRKDAEIVYYQWLPLLLVAQAVVFYIPHALWCSLNSSSGVDADDILQASQSLDITLELKKRKSRMKLIRNQIHRFVSSPRNRTEGCSFSVQHILSSLCGCICGKRFGNYLTVLYIFMKLIYIGNVVLQMYLLGPIFQTAFHELGWTAIQNALAEKPHWIHPGIFPTVTMCDFKIRRLGNNHNYSMQCVLPINVFAEKMFLFIWCWFSLIIFISTLNLLMWVLRAAFPGSRRRYIQDHLQTTNRLDTERKHGQVPGFVSKYLKHDGVFLIRLIGHNTSQLTAADVTASLWDAWLERKAARKIEENKPEQLNCENLEPEPQPRAHRNSIDKLPLPTISNSIPMNIPMGPVGRMPGEGMAGGMLPGCELPTGGMLGPAGGGMQKSGFPGEGMPGAGLPIGGMPEGGIPGGMPGGGLPVGGMPGGGLPVGGMPGGGLPVGGMPGGGLPVGGMPGGGLPVGGMPRGGLPGGGMPGGGLPVGGMPRGGMPHLPDYTTSNTQYFSNPSFDAMTHMGMLTPGTPSSSMLHPWSSNV